MLFIENEGAQFRWHVGEPISWKLNNKLHWRDCIVTADGDELDYILRHFQNLPFNNSRQSQTWRGEFARFIAENM